MVKKDFAVYKLKKGSEMVYIGITNDFTRRINEYINDEKNLLLLTLLKYGILAAKLKK